MAPPNQTPEDLARVVMNSARSPVLLDSQGRKQHLSKIEFTYVFLSHIEGCLFVVELENVKKTDP